MASTTITDADQAAISRDVARYTLTRPRILAVWAVLALLLVVQIVGIAGQLAHGEAPFALAWVVAAIVLAAPIYTVLVTARTTLRSIRAAFPVGSVVTAAVDDDRLTITTERGNVDMALSSFSECAALGSALLLRQAASRIGVVVPRAALDIEAVRQLHAHVGRGR